MNNDVEDYEIKCNHRFSWSYIYSTKEKSYELWSESLEDLKKKILAKNLPWDDEKVPKEIPKSKVTYNLYKNSFYDDEEDRPYRRSGWWVPSIYKRY